MTTPPRDVLAQIVAEMRADFTNDCDIETIRLPFDKLCAKVHAYADRIERALAGQGEVERDAERLDFLESLMKRKRKFGWQDKEWPLDTDLHISAMGAALYARSGIGSDCDFSARGKTVRETIDAARTQEPR